MAIQLTEKAAQRVLSFMEPHHQGLRLAVYKAGCSGWAYQVDLTDFIDPQQDVVNTHRGVTVAVNRQHLALVDGTEIDFIQQGLSQHFAFNNPNMEEACGCGESFTVADSPA